MTESTTISLFSGAGGLDVAAHSAGYATSVAIELESSFANTLTQNRWLSRAAVPDFDSWFQRQTLTMGRLTPAQQDALRARVLPGVGHENAVTDAHIINDDIANVDAEHILHLAGKKPGEIELVIGGPPCQSFSKSGKRHSLNDLRGQLFLQFSRVIKETMPRWFVFENVKGITNSAALVCEIDCSNCGPSLAAQELLIEDPNKQFYPCRRCGRESRIMGVVNDGRGALKVILDEFESLGYKCEYSILNAIDFGAPQSRERLFIVGSRDGESFSFPKPTHGVNKHKSQTSLIDSLGGELKPFETTWSALFESGRNLSHHWPLDPDIAVLWVKNVVRPHDEPVTWDLRRPSPTIGAHQGAKLAIAPHGVPEAQLARQQWHTLGRRQGDTPPVKVNHSYLSDEDLLRLQTFPPSWFLSGTRMQRAFQVGNAVPPILGTAVLKALAKASDKRLDLDLDRAAARNSYAS